MTHPQPDPPRNLAAQALAEFWADMGLEEGRVLSARLQARRGTPAPRQQAPGQSPGQSLGQSLGQPQSRTTPARPAGPRPEPRRLGGNPIADARRIAAAADSLAELRAAVQAFDGCDLKKASKNTVVCDGAFDAPVMIVGEAPGGEEDARGLPFVGRAGKLLDKMLATVGLSREDNVYITNLIYWRPPGNRDPSPVEMQICAPFLMRQIELKQPKLLLTVGKFATHAMLGRDEGIMRLRGRKLSYEQDGIAAIPTIPMLHPAYLLRNPAHKAKAWDDLRAIAKLCDELGIKRAPGL